MRRAEEEQFVTENSSSNVVSTARRKQGVRRTLALALIVVSVAALVAVSVFNRRAAAFVASPAPAAAAVEPQQQGMSGVDFRSLQTDSASSSPALLSPRDNSRAPRWSRPQSLPRLPSAFVTLTSDVRHLPTDVILRIPRKRLPSIRQFQREVRPRHHKRARGVPQTAASPPHAAAVAPLRTIPAASTRTAVSLPQARLARQRARHASCGSDHSLTGRLSNFD